MLVKSRRTWGRNRGERGLDWKGVTRWEEARGYTETLQERQDSKSKDRLAGLDQTQILTVAKCQIFYTEQFTEVVIPN